MEVVGTESDYCTEYSDEKLVACGISLKTHDASRISPKWKPSSITSPIQRCQQCRLLQKRKPKKIPASAQTPGPKGLLSVSRMSPGEAKPVKAWCRACTPYPAKGQVRQGVWGPLDLAAGADVTRIRSDGWRDFKDVGLSFIISCN